MSEASYRLLTANFWGDVDQPVVINIAVPSSVAPPLATVHWLVRQLGWDVMLDVDVVAVRVMRGFGQAPRAMIDFAPGAQYTQSSSSSVEVIARVGRTVGS